MMYYIARVLIDGEHKVIAEYTTEIGPFEYDTHHNDRVTKKPRRLRAWLILAGGHCSGAAAISQSPEGAKASARMLLTELRLGHVVAA